MTRNDPIPPPVADLVRRLGSVSEVEVLVLLVRDRRPWTLAELARHLVVDERHAQMLLEASVQHALIRRHGDEYAFDPTRESDRETAEDLARLYATYRHRVMDIVLSRRRSAAEDFADAFRLRPPDDEEV
jgi:hypothetical protein